MISLIPQGSAASQGAAIFSGDDLERRIDYQALLLHTVETPDERREVLAELVRLRGMRTPERVVEMEREQGLR